jgi:hypothetical protein
MALRASSIEGSFQDRILILIKIADFNVKSAYSSRETIRIKLMASPE